MEEFRQLAATLHQTQATNNLRVVMVTSAEPNEGKSTTALNLALTFSESYKRKVLLIDADLRRPSLHEITQVPERQRSRRDPEGHRRAEAAALSAVGHADAGAGGAARFESDGCAHLAAHAA